MGAALARHLRIGRSLVHPALQFAGHLLSSYLRETPSSPGVIRADDDPHSGRRLGIREVPGLTQDTQQVRIGASAGVPTVLALCFLLTTGNFFSSWY